jgi:hypothetical protein
VAGANALRQRVIGDMRGLLRGNLCFLKNARIIEER